MATRCQVLIVGAGLAGLAIMGDALAQSPDPNSPRYKGVVTLSDFLISESDEALQAFADERVSRELLGSTGRQNLVTELKKLRSKFAGARMSGARPEGPFAAYIEFSNGESISFEMEVDAPHRFVRIGSIGKSQGSAPSAGCTTPEPQRDLETFADLDAKLRAEAEAERFSGVALVAIGSKPLFLEAYGYADKAGAVRNRKDTKSNLGSINKLFTMVAVYQLLDKGKIALDDTIGQYLPDFPPSVAGTVTVRHLLEHKSGWGAYWDNPTWNARRMELRTLGDYMSFIKDIPLGFEPGSRKQYSNTGYEVLGAVVEKASGQSYYDYVRDYIYKPARMNDTDAYERDGKTPNMAIGYVGDGYGDDNSSILAVKGTAAGGGYATAQDLMRFAAALNDGSLIPAKYASRLRGGGFAGGAPGVNAALELNVAGDHTVIVLSNFDPPTGTRTAQEISALLRDKQAAESGTQRYRIGVGLAPHDEGISVNFLVPDGPGEKSGLEPDDVILALNGKSITDDPIAAFDELLVKPDPIRMDVRRGTKSMLITITPEPMGGAIENVASATTPPCKPECTTPVATDSNQLDPVRFVGVVTQAPDAETTKSMNLATRIRTEGRVIQEVIDDTPAERAGLRVGDVLLQIGDNRLYSGDGLGDYLRTAKPGTHGIRFKRKGHEVEREGNVTLSSDDLPRTTSGIRWQFSGMGQLDKAIAAAQSEGKKLLVGLSGSETCCAFSRFESPSVAASIQSAEVAQLAKQFVTIIIRRPHAYWFLEQISGYDENAPILALPDGLKLPNGEVLPIPSVFILEANREVVDRVALAHDGAAGRLRRTLAKHSAD